jgi:hypothetical protein
MTWTKLINSRSYATSLVCRGAICLLKKACHCTITLVQYGAEASA